MSNSPSRKLIISCKFALVAHVSLSASKKVILNVFHFSRLSDLLSRKLLLSRVRLPGNSVTEIKANNFYLMLSQVYRRANELPLRLLGKLINKPQFHKPLPQFTNYHEIWHYCEGAPTHERANCFSLSPWHFLCQAICFIEKEQIKLYHECFSLKHLFCRDNGNEPSVPHPDPAVRGSQVPRGGECSFIRSMSHKTLHTFSQKYFNVHKNDPFLAACPQQRVIFV